MKRVYLLCALCLSAAVGFGRQANRELFCVLPFSPKAETSSSIEVAVTIDQQSPVIGCGTAVTLTASVTGAAELSWLRNGEYIDGATTSTFVANQSGTYTVIAVALTCQAQSQPVEVIIESPLNASILLPSGNTACEGESVELQATGGNAQWQWYFEGSAIPGATNQNYLAEAPGSYGVVGNESSLCASTSSLVQVVINPLPEVTLVWDGSPTICADESIVIAASLSGAEELEWYYNGASVLIGETTFAASLGGEYYAIATNVLTGCSSETNSLTLEVLPVQNIAIAAIGGTSFCQGQSTVLELINGSGSVQWQASGINVEGATGSVLHVSSEATYSAIVTDENGCASYSNNVLVEVLPLPTTALSIDGSASAVLCGNDDELLAQAEVGDVYVWYASGEVLPGEVSSTLLINEPGEYAVQLTNEFGCVAVSEPLFVEQYGLPQVMLEPSGTVTLCEGQTLYIEAVSNAANQFEWYADGVLLSKEFNGYLETSEAGEYTVRVFDENGCDVMSTPAIVQLLSVDTPVITDGGITDDGQLLVVASASGNQWYFNGEAINGATQSTYVASASGVYTVISIEDVCESALSEAFEVVISSIQEYGETLLVYPNPCMDILVIEGMSFQGLPYTVYDAAGRIVLHGLAAGARTQIDVHELHAGMYRLALTGGERVTFSVVR
jgi:hypothetical protein